MEKPIFSRLELFAASAARCPNVGFGQLSRRFLPGKKDFDAFSLNKSTYFV
jgi:hypothetical protein